MLVAAIKVLSFWYETVRAFQPRTVNAEPLNLGLRFSPIQHLPNGVCQVLYFKRLHGEFFNPQLS